MRITSTRIDLHGAHEHVSVWVDGKLAGTLVVGENEGARLVEMLEWGSQLVTRTDAIERAMLPSRCEGGHGNG